jgi:hypothetical protein
MRWQALLLAALVLTSGCLGMGGDEANDTQDLDTQDTETTNTTDEDPEPTNRTEWSKETFEGTITGTTFLAPSPPSEGQSFTFTAQSGIETLFVNVTTDGGDLRVLVAGPDCEINSACEEETQTEGGEGQYVNESAAPGEWDVRLFPADPVAAQVGYTADVVQGILVQR